MRISERLANDGSLSPEHRATDKTQSDRFSHVMKDQNRRANGKDAAASTKNGVGAPQSSISEPASAIQSPGAPCSSNGVNGVNAASPSDGRASGLSSPEKDAQVGAPPSTQLNALANEMGAHMDLFKQGAASQTMHITFDSKSLEGLQVQIRQQDGQTAIHFMTQSPQIANFLNSHSGELRETLTSKGVKVETIAVANTATRPIVRKGRDG